jgi:hypothetical protein
MYSISRYNTDPVLKNCTLQANWDGYLQKYSWGLMSYGLSEQ